MTTRRRAARRLPKYSRHFLAELQRAKGRKLKAKELASILPLLAQIETEFRQIKKSLKSVSPILLPLAKPKRAPTRH